MDVAIRPVRRPWRTLLTEAGLMIPTGESDGEGKAKLRPKYGLRDLRHYAASAWIDQGIDLKRLHTWMGHSTIMLTLNTYGHQMRDAGRMLPLQAEPRLAD